MARISKLTDVDTAKIRKLHYKIPVHQIAKKFGVSESTVYKVFDGSYIARPNLEAKTISPRIKHKANQVRLEDFDELTLSVVGLILDRANSKIKQVLHTVH